MKKTLNESEIKNMLSECIVEFINENKYNENIFDFLKKIKSKTKNGFNNISKLIRDRFNEKLREKYGSNLNQYLNYNKNSNIGPSDHIELLKK